MRVTEEQVRQAEQKAEAAERERDTAARELEASPYSDITAMRHSDASRLAAQLRSNARELKAAFEEQVAAERAAADRGALEKAAAGDIKAAGVAMAEQERVLGEALAEVQKAIVVLLEAGMTYNALVEGHAHVLEAAGLDVRGGESGGERTVLGRYQVKVGGRLYEQVDAASLGAWMLQRVVEARLGRFHPLASQLQWLARAVEQDASAVVAGVPDPKRVGLGKK